MIASTYLPVLLPIILQHLPANFAAVPVNAILAFLYVSIFSMFLGFFAWYRGLALGGIAIIVQLQLIPAIPNLRYFTDFLTIIDCF